MIDFTLNSYLHLLEALQSRSFSFVTFHQYAAGLATDEKWVVLRQDVDQRPENALRMATLQAERGIRATYYFRSVKQSFDERIIKAIAAMGHEIGFHYETMDSQKGNVEKAYREFCQLLEIFRDIAEIKTISMHGSPLSPYDNREIWKHYDYRQLGIIGEPYFDLDFNRVLYLTDTGRRWDGHRFNVRDKATKDNPLTNPDFRRLRFRHTSDICNAIETHEFPARAMLNVHPQRWNDSAGPWLRELLLQNLKNEAKRWIASR